MQDADEVEAKEILVRANGLSASCMFSCPADSSVKDAKALIESETDIPRSELRICFGERELRDVEKLDKLIELDELELSFLRRDPEQARWLEAAMQDADSTFLSEAPSNIRDDHEVVLAAVMQNGEALKFASDRLRSDKLIVLQAIEEDARAFRYAAACLHANRDVMMSAVHRNGLTLENAVQELRQDRELVEAAVCQNGLALRYASAVLQADKEIVRLALQSDPNAIDFAAPELRELSVETS